MDAEGVQCTDEAVYQEIRKQRPARGLGAEGVQGTDKAVYQEIRKQRPARELGANVIVASVASDCVCVACSEMLVVASIASFASVWDDCGFPG